jgi:hypothetical protein
MNRVIFVFFLIVASVIPLKSSGEGRKEPNPLQESLALGEFKIVNKGAVCPFTGYLITFEGIASIISKFEIREKKFELKLKTETDYYKMRMKKQDEVYLSMISNDRDKYEKIIRVKEDKIRKLEKNYNPKVEPFFGKKFWIGVGIGVVTGVLMSYGTIYLYGKVK